MITAPPTWIPSPPDQTAHREPCAWARNFRVYHRYPGGSSPPSFCVSGRPHDFFALYAMGCRMFLTWEPDADTPHLQRRCEVAGLPFLRIPVEDEAAPTDLQVEQFRGIVMDESNWPLVTSCHGGEHRSNLGAVLVRVGLDGWTLEDALREAERFNLWHGPVPPSWTRAFEGGPLARAQMEYVTSWYQSHPPGAWRVG